MTTGDPRIPDRAVLSGPAWVAQAESNALVDKRLSWAFAPHAGSSPPNMQVFLKAGAIVIGNVITELALQNTANITAPSSDPRIDRIVIDQITGIVEVVTGSEAASPVPPAVPVGKLPIAQVSLLTSTTEITNTDLTDERVFGLSNNPLSTFFEGIDTTPVANAESNFNHGLGGIPLLVVTVMQCKTTDLGFAVDDELVVTSMSHVYRQDVTGGPTHRFGITTWADATKVYARMGSEGIQLTEAPDGSQPDGGSGAILTLSRWDLVIRAWR